MPLYEYKCDGCGEVFEVMQKFADEPLAVHAKCGGPVHRLISAPAFQFKGTGWYVTDYAKSGNGSSNKSDKESKPAGEKKSESQSSSESKTESKPAESKSGSTEKSKSE